MGENLTIAEHRAPVAPSHYIWSFPGSPVNVQLDLDVVERFQRQQHAIAGEQGLLLGRILGQATEISDFLSIPGSKPPDPDAIEALSAGLPGDASRVGYYRIQHGGSLRLNEHDLSLASAAFSDPQQVFLLIQLSDAGPANATFFFWDDGRMCGDFPFLEFPLDATLLAAAERHRVEAAQQKALANAAAVDSAFLSNRQAPRSRPASKTVFLILALGLVVLALALLPVSRIAGKLFPKTVPPIAVTTPAELPHPISIGLQAERQRGDLKLTWDRTSSLIAHATSGVVSIQDGASQREIPLDSKLVRGGSLLYSPGSDQVQMQLTVTGPERTTTETVIVILPKVGPPQIQTTHVKTAQSAEGKTANARNNPASAAPPITSENTASKNRTPSQKPVNTPSHPVDRQTVSSPIALGEAPVLQPGFNPNATLPLSGSTNFVPGPAAATGGPASIGSPLPINVPDNSRQPVDAAAAPPEVAQHASEYHPAEVMRQEVPRIPATVPKPKIYSAISVEVKVSIDKTGKVVKATPLPKKGANPVLVLAAVDAARHWTFQPARIGDQPLASEMTIGFNFNPTH